MNLVEPATDYVAGSTKINKFYSNSMVEHFTFLDDFNNTWIIIYLFELED